MGSWIGWQFRRSAAVAEPETAEKPFAEQFQQMQLACQMASQMSRFKSSFLAQTSHELRSPLNSVISLHQLILSNLCDSPAEEREFVAQAHTAAHNMLRLLDQMIHISKLEYGTSPLQIQPLQLRELIAEVQRSTYLQAQNRNLRFEVELPDPTIHVLADDRCLRQALVSLIIAAITQMQAGTIRLSTRVLSEAGQAEILVADQQSADPHDAASAGRGASSLEPSPELTLMLSQTLMQLMQGNLEVKAASPTAAPSDFTQICCTIPLAQDTVASIAVSS